MNWSNDLAEAEIEQICQSALGQSIPGRADKCVVFHHLDMLKSRISHLNNAFPDNCLHAVAIKANPLIEILRELVKHGAGLEAASLEEAHLALAAGCQAEKLVYDSPAKTIDELEAALHKGFVINADSFEELERIDNLLSHMHSKSAIGLRINPMVGAGSIGITSVADERSKFGVRIDNDKDRIIQAFAAYDWLKGVHIHIGSQGCDLDLLVSASKVLNSLIHDLCVHLGEDRIAYADIGGGLSAKYHSDDKPQDIIEYVALLKKHAPGLFSDRLKLITEMGRSVQAGCGFCLSKIEYVKPFGDHEIAIIHLGADMFLRPVYLHDQWRHRFLVLDSHGKLKHGSTKTYTIGGPLCFSGDILAREIRLPEIHIGDFCIIRDAGAYTLSMWSRHCSRALPRVVGVSRQSNYKFRELFKGESLDDVVRFWSKD